MGLFGKKRAPSDPGPGVGSELREMALGVDPESIGVSRRDAGPVWGLVMDTVFAEGDWYTLVVLADGTASLYTSSTFGIIGAGMHDGVRAAGTELLATVAAQLDEFVPAAEATLPPGGMVAIRALTFDGQRVVVAPEDEFGYGRHPASVVFHSAHDVITLMRQAAEATNP